jgi:murein DD-endopeptidase MepM/ murein hydrolase activator NlpD
MEKRIGTFRIARSQSQFTLRAGRCDRLSSAFSILVAFLLVGCASPAPVTPAPSATPAFSATPALILSPTPTATLLPSATFTPVLSPTTTSTSLPSATPTPQVEICSPLEGISLAELGQPDLLKNPFDPPRPGFDSGHQGADFSYWSRGERTTMLGLPVRAVLAGRVAGVILNRYPYGNAVIIETPLDALPIGWIEAMPVSTPGPTIVPSASLYCPAGADFGETGRGRSLYLLYAHLQEAPQVGIGKTVSCGEQIGQVGTTGKSVNPHLHLETRVGPSGATFREMAHYENDATDKEMANYCAWRVSGLFQMFDPLSLLSLQP